MNKISIILLLCLFSAFTTVKSDCGTPIECYSKAIESLKQDRSEMKFFRERMQILINQKNKELKASLEEKFKVKEKAWDKKNEDLQKEFQAQVEEFKKNIKALQTEVNTLKQKVETLARYDKKKDNMYLESKIYDNIFQAMDNGVIKKIGSPNGWNDQSHKTNPWNSKLMLNIGTGAQSNGNGLQVNVPKDYNVLWLRCSNHVWGAFRLKYSDGNKEDLGKFACGHRNLNGISPDGAAPDSYNTVHRWAPIRITRAGVLDVYSDINSDSWISGIAFGKNLWNHAVNSAIAYHWKLNGGTDGWNTDNWNSDNLGLIVQQKINELYVPISPSGKDKLLYLIEYNSNWLGTMHTSIKVNGTPIERFRTSYGNNPFATHFNSKYFDRYMAALVPNSLIPKDALFIKVEIDMRQQNEHIYYREVGTHDFE